MTPPVTTEALVDRKALRKTILAAIPENVPLRGRYATAIMEQAVAPLLAAHQQVTAERDEADRRAGAAEREAESDRKDALKRKEWLHRAKQQAGYSTNVSFDKVWAEALEKAARADADEAELARLRAEGEAKDRALAEIAADAAAGARCTFKASFKAWFARIEDAARTARARAATVREGQSDDA